MKIGKRIIGEGKSTFVIAEIGINHNGKLDLALRMIKVAAQCGADAVKFQIVDPDEAYGVNTLSHQIFTKYRLSVEDYQRLCRCAAAEKIIIFATPGDLTSLELMRKLKMPLLKISSSSLTNYVLIRECVKTKLPLIISTGMSYLAEVQRTVEAVRALGGKNLGLLHCVSEYPTPFSSVNLNAMQEMASTFHCLVGYSDHTEGNLASITAVAMGATMIEKHFTLSKKLRGPDHQFSSDPVQFKKMVEEIRNIEVLKGSEVKRPTLAEKSCRKKFRRFIVARENIDKGSLLMPNMLTIKRIKKGQHLSPFEVDEIIGKTVNKYIKKDTGISRAMFQN